MRSRTLESGDIQSVDEQGAAGVIGGDGAIAGQVAAQNGLEVGFAREADLAVQFTSDVGASDFARSEHAFVVGYGGDDEAVTGNIGTRFRRENIDAVVVFCILHDGPVEAMNAHGSLLSGVHCHATNLVNLRKREDVGNGLTIEPDGTKIWKITKEAGVLVTAISDDTEHVGAASNVCEHGGVF